MNKLFKFAYSPYARKVQAVLDLLGAPYEALEVPYGDRTQLVAATGGYIQVPVLIDDTGKVWTESRRICEHLLTAERNSSLAPVQQAGPIWAYADFCDGPLEDVLFRIATPYLVGQKASPMERALFVHIKERKFGVGCVERWAEEQPTLLARGRELLAPSARTLGVQPFLFGATATLADAALYGNIAMLSGADPSLPLQLGDVFPAFKSRFEERCAATSAQRIAR